jgi:hypothetical protein
LAMLWRARKPQSIQRTMCGVYEVECQIVAPIFSYDTDDEAPAWGAFC